MTARQTLSLLRKYESRNVTYLDPDGSWPIVWDRARGEHVWDASGKKYLDLTAAFGVAAAGHANPAVVRAGQKQMGRLLHAMGDVHPHALKAELARELSRLTFERWSVGHGSPRTPRRSGKTIFCNSGFEAVEAALKSARLATDKPGVIAFAGAYHGLGYGALNLTHRDHFRSPFRDQLRRFGHFVPFPVADTVPSPGARTFLSADQNVPNERDQLAKLSDKITGLFGRQRIGAILVEPIQARGGINIPPPGFLPLLRTLCDKHGAWLILDEIYTGFGRTGAWFACEHSQVVPGCDLSWQGADRRIPAVGLRRKGRPDGPGLAGVRRRSHSHQHVPGTSGWLCDGPGSNPGNPETRPGIPQCRSRGVAAGRTAHTLSTRVRFVFKCALEVADCSRVWNYSTPKAPRPRRPPSP